jgi:hypothetical protein
MRTRLLKSFDTSGGSAARLARSLSSREMEAEADLL